MSTNPIPYIPETAPFTAEQRAWLNGFLAGLFAQQSHQTALPAPPKPSLAVLFGSQTGTAEQIAKRVSREAEKRGFASRALAMNDFTKVDLSKEERLVIVTSTWGEGDPPDNAVAFWNHLNTPTAPQLSHLQFSVLALGDSSYSEFCGAGKKFDARLEQLGAKRFLPRIDCDKDYDSAANAWIESLWTALPVVAPQSASPAVPSETPQQTSSAVASKSYSRTNPFPAHLVTNCKLNEGDKETRHFEISIAGSGLTYEAGDALGIFPTNCPELVSQIIQKLGCDGEEEVVINGETKTSLRVALQRECEIHRISTSLVKAAAGTNDALRSLTQVENKLKLDEYLTGRDVFDLLSDFAVKLSAGEFVATLKKLTPRLYSIASSPRAHPDEVHLTVAIVRRHFNNRGRKGVCSTFLAERVSDKVPVPVFIQGSGHFRPPQDPGVAAIMVGPGTGIAPFRGFLQERAVIGAKGRNWLFFGHQHAATDFFYQDELLAMQKNGVLTRFDTAFSRDQKEKIYVQHRMLQHAAEIWAWLQDGAHFYVCGDASRMAKDVDIALHQIARQTGGLSTDNAAAFVADLRKTKRYQRDVY